MATMNISLPDEMKAWVEEQARSGQYAGASDVIRDLIRRRQRKEAALAELDRLVAEADASGFAEGTPEEILERIKRDARALAAEADHRGAA